MLPPWFPSPASRPDSVTKVVLLPPVTEAELSLQPPRPRPRDLEYDLDLLAPGLPVPGPVTGLLDSSTEDSESNSSELRSAPFCLKRKPATNQSLALQRQSEFNRYLTMSKLPT